MNISNYEDLLDAANTQEEPQRLLLVFARADLPDDSTQDQQQQFQARRGGTLTPVMCVDKLASEESSFATLSEESRQMGMDWDIMFAACLSGKSGIAPSSHEAEAPLNAMIKSIQVGSIGNFLAFDREGELVRLKAA